MKLLKFLHEDYIAHYIKGRKEDRQRNW